MDTPSPNGSAPPPAPKERTREERARIEQRLVIARRFRAARGDSGMTLQDVAAVAGCSDSTVSALEQGERDVYFSTVVAACDAVGLPIDWLVCGIPDVGSPRLRRLFRG